LFFELQLADTTACNGDRSMFVAQINHMKMMCHQLIEMNAAFSLKDLKINGNDLMGIGYTGKRIGETLSALLECVISETCVNEADVLLEKAKALFRSIHNEA
jgi:tRNA nucleotidyltransferase (CCA-adding enzyme)